jgi:hypothetical protein
MPVSEFENRLVSNWARIGPSSVGRGYALDNLSEGERKLLHHG